MADRQQTRMEHLTQSPPSPRAQDEHSGPLHAAICSQITTVSGCVLFQFQHMNLSLFDEHGSIMRAVFVTVFLYVVGLMVGFNLDSQSCCSTIIKQFTPLFGLFAVVLLLFILWLPLGLAASIIWAFLIVWQIQKIIQCLPAYRQAPRDNSQNV